MSQPVLYYSNRCAHSRTVLQTLDQMNKSALVQAVCIDTIPRQQLPPFLKSVPTLYNPETRDVYVGQQIYAYIAKPVGRREVPVTQTAPTGVAKGGAPPQQQMSAGGGDPMAWDLTTGGFTEPFSLWDAPGKFADDSQSRYTYLDGAALAGAPDMKPQNLQQRAAPGDVGGGSEDIQKRLQAMQQQREKEFTAVSRQ